MSELEIRKAVKERYAKIAISSDSSCCAGGECDDSGLISLDVTVPVEASSVNAGCGSPLLLVTPQEGDVVLDLGSGGGIDIFRASQLVGKSGRAIGVDATPEMVWRARETKSKYGDKYVNAEFRLGEIEHLPIDSNSVDYVISNCVINLSPDKLAVFKESFRVLKEDGVFAVADVTLQDEIPEAARKDMDSWSECIAGALTDKVYERLLTSAGFKDVEISHISDSNIGKYPFAYFSSHIKAKKPTGSPSLGLSPQATSAPLS
jgi:arsenite methyltransferase